MTGRGHPAAAFRGRAGAAPRPPAQPAWVVRGPCSVCGEPGSYRQGHRSIREGFPCASCGASLRYRHQAAVIVDLYARRGSASLRQLVAEPEFAGLAVYEPGLIGPFRACFEALPGYTTSYYWDGVPSGSFHRGVRREDLHALTFPDESFDLVVTSDILEHVRRPEAVFAEIARVLAPGGRHVFTVPLGWPIPRASRTRVDASGDEDVFLLPPVYHGSPTDPAGSLVYTDFGSDLADRLAELGTPTRLVPGYLYAGTFVSEKRP